MTTVGGQTVGRSAPRIHDLKCDSGPFHAIRAGLKRAEVRVNDRDFRTGDILVLRERFCDDMDWHDWTVSDLERWEREDATGEVELARVTHVLPGGQYGIEEGYVLLSIQRVRLVAADEGTA